jgi:3-phosphoshikimate 1-carboxyvinyltransferase
VAPQEISALVDEVPILAVAAAMAEGTTAFRGLAELRLKETDRVDAVAAELALMGVEVRSDGDDLLVTGGRLHGAEVDSHGDHRMAMSLSVAAALAAGESQLSGAAAAAVSYPGFFETLAELAGSSS